MRTLVTRAAHAAVRPFSFSRGIEVESATASFINQAGSVRAMKDVGKVASAIKLPSRADASARDSNARHVCFGTRRVLTRLVSRHHSPATTATRRLIVLRPKRDTLKCLL